MSFTIRNLNMNGLNVVPISPVFEVQFLHNWLYFLFQFWMVFWTMSHKLFLLHSSRITKYYYPCRREASHLAWWNKQKLNFFFQNVLLNIGSIWQISILCKYIAISLIHLFNSRPDLLLKWCQYCTPFTFRTWDFWES